MNAELSKIGKNRMGTLSIDLKIKGMRKPQDFIFYPINKETQILMIQSDTRIAKLSLDGKGVMSRPHQNGAYSVHLSIDKLTPFIFTNEDWQKIKDALKLTSCKEAGKKENGIIQSDNSGAISIFNL
ncbi:MAG: hypothetical protein ACJA1B_001419 [Polaribacter sp.]|jgi:hypothetical protein